MRNFDHLLRPSGFVAAAAETRAFVGVGRTDTWKRGVVVGRVVGGRDG